MQGRGRSIGLFLAIMALSIALQREGGAYRVALGEHGDEPAHFVTGLMVRDSVRRRLLFALSARRYRPLASDVLHIPGGLGARISALRRGSAPLDSCLD